MPYDCALRSEICGDFEDRTGVLRPDQFATVLIGFDVGAAETIDRLLRIAHEEQRPGPELAFLPGSPVSRYRGDREENLVLNPISVLKLVDQNELVSPPDGLPHVVLARTRSRTCSNRSSKSRTAAARLLSR